MQICTAPQTDNLASIPPLNLLQAGCPSCHPTNSIKALKHNTIKYYCNINSDHSIDHVLIIILCAIVKNMTLKVLVWVVSSEKMEEKKKV